MPIARDLAELGFRLIATRGTAAYLRAYGLDVDVVFKVNEGRPNIADEIVNRKIDLDRQHAARPRVVLRRSRRAPRRDDARGAVHHHADRRRRRGQRDPRACASTASASARCRTTTQELPQEASSLGQILSTSLVTQPRSTRRHDEVL